MKKVTLSTVLSLIIIGSLAVAAPKVEDQFSVPTGNFETGNYNVKYRADLAAQGMLSNVEISVQNLKRGQKFLGKFFKGPGLLTASLAQNGQDLSLVFTNADGTKETTTVELEDFGLAKCVDVGGHFRVCIDQSIASSGIFGSNISVVVVQNLNIVDECGSIGSAYLPRTAAVNKTFSTYYFPNTYEAYNANPVLSVRAIQKNGQEFVELTGHHGVYSRNEGFYNIEEPNKDTFAELLDVSKFNLLKFVKGACPGDPAFGG